MSGFFDFVARQATRIPPAPVVDLTGKNVIVTGSNTGLGFESALGLAKLKPARLIVACRNVQKGENAAQKIRDDPAVSSETSVEVWQLDLADFASVKAFVEKVNKELARLDIVIENAGLTTMKYNTTKDGWEVLTQVNVISTFLLAIALIPLLRKTASLYSPTEKPPRMVIVSSDSQHWTSFKARKEPNIFKALNDPAKFEGPSRYATSKLMEVFLARELAERVNSATPEIGICTVHPGMCHSDIAKEMTSNIIIRVIFGLITGIFARTTAQGGAVLNHAALCDLDLKKGEYLSECHVAETAKIVTGLEGKKIQEKLWEELMSIFDGLGVEHGFIA